MSKSRRCDHLRNQQYSCTVVALSGAAEEFFAKLEGEFKDLFLNGSIPQRSYLNNVGSAREKAMEALGLAAEAIEEKRTLLAGNFMHREGAFNES